MHSSPTDLASVIVVIAGALVLGVLLSRGVNRYRSPGPPLRLLTGTRSQQASLRLALAPVLHEFGSWVAMERKTGLSHEDLLVSRL
jgi:hypothetical protein